MPAQSMRDGIHITWESLYQCTNVPVLAAGGISYSVSVGVVNAVVAFSEFGNGYGNLMPSALYICSEEQGFFKLWVQWRKRADPRNTLI